MPEDVKPTIKPEAELPVPHDMLLKSGKADKNLPVSHWQQLKSPSFNDKYPWVKWLILFSILILPVSSSVFLSSQLEPTDEYIPLPTAPMPTVAMISEPTLRLTVTTIPATGEEEVVYPPVVELARADLAKRLGVSAQDIALVSYTEQEWPDSSLGCPTKDMGYLQVITPGYRVILRAEEKTYMYHTDTNTRVVLCEALKYKLDGESN